MLRLIEEIVMLSDYGQAILTRSDPMTKEDLLGLELNQVCTS